jgi:hypothetical protein
MHPSALSSSPYDHRRCTARICICGKIGGRLVLGNTRGAILRPEMVPTTARIKPFRDYGAGIAARQSIVLPPKGSQTRPRFLSSRRFAPRCSWLQYRARRLAPSRTGRWHLSVHSVAPPQLPRCVTRNAQQVLHSKASIIRRGCGTARADQAGSGRVRTRSLNRSHSVAFQISVNEERPVLQLP